MGVKLTSFHNSYGKKGKGKIMRKKVVAGLMAALMVTSMVGCGTKSGSGSAKKSTSNGKVTLTVWGPQEDQNDDCHWLKEQCEAFAKANPDMKLEFKYAVCSEGDAGKNVTEDASKAADVYMFANDQIPSLVAANAISKLGGDTLDQVKSMNSEAMVNSVTYDGSVYGVPFTGNTWFMYYDKSVFTEDDVKNLDTMLKKGKVGFPLSNSWYIGAMYAANGTTFFGADGQDQKAGIDRSAEKADPVTNYLVDLAANPNFVDSGVDKYDNTAAMKAGDIKACFSGTWDYKNMKEALGDNLGVTVAPTITINGEQKQMKAFAGSKAIGVNPNCKNQKEAVALALYLGSKDAQKAHFDERAIIPTIADVDASSNPAAKVQNDTIDNASVLQPVFSEMGSWWDPAAAMGKAFTATDDTKVTHANASEQTAKFNELANKH